MSIVCRTCYDDLVSIDTYYVCRACENKLNQKLAIAVEALELTIDTLDHLQYCLYESADTRFTQNRLATARAALEKVK